MIVQHAKFTEETKLQVETKYKIRYLSLSLFRYWYVDIIS